MNKSLLILAFVVSFFSGNAKAGVTRVVVATPYASVKVVARTGCGGGYCARAVAAPVPVYPAYPYYPSSCSGGGSHGGCGGYSGGYAAAGCVWGPNGYVCGGAAGYRYPVNYYGYGTCGRCAYQVSYAYGYRSCGCYYPRNNFSMAVSWGTGGFAFGW